MEYNDADLFFLIKNKKLGKQCLAIVVQHWKMYYNFSYCLFYCCYTI